MNKLFLILLFLFCSLLLYCQTPQWSWAIQVGGDQVDIGMGIATDNQGYVYTTGYFSDDITFDNTALSSVGSSDVYLAKLHSGQVGNDDDTTPIDPNASILYKAYPNPLHIGQSLSIKSYIAPGDQGELTLYNLRGQLVSHYTLSEGEHKIMPDVSNLSSGIYFYRLRTGAVKSVHKLVLIK